MRSVPPLPSKVEHEEGEPAYALLIRTLEHNGSRRIGKSIDRVTGAREKATSCWDPTEIARICRADLGAVRHATPVVGSRIAEVMGQTLSAEHLGIRTRRWCPSCIKERPYHRVWWDVLPVTSCPEHGTKLTSSCGCEGRPLRWRSGTLRHCPAGHALAEVACAEAEPEVLAFDTYVVSRLRGEGGRSHAGFDDVPLGRLISICERLGKASVDDSGSIHDVRRSNPAGRLHAEGFRILRGLPGTLDDLLGQLRAGEASRRDLCSVRRAYGPLYTFVRRLPPHSVGSALQSALAGNAVRNLRVRNRTRLDGRTPIERDGIVTSKAAEALGITYERLSVLLDRLGIRRGERVGSSELSLSDFETLKASLDGFRSLGQVGRELGLPPLEVAGIASSGLLDVTASGQGATGWIFPHDAAANLLAKIRSRTARSGPTPARFVTLPVAATSSGGSIAQVLSLVLSDAVEVRARWSGRKGVSCFHVDLPAVTRNLRLARVSGVTPVAAARELGLTLTAMEAILAIPLLLSETVDGFTRIPDDEVVRFRASWASMRELRAAMNVPALLPVAIALREAGVGSPLAKLAMRDRVYPRESALRVCAVAARTEYAGGNRDWNFKVFAAGLNLSSFMAQQLVEAGLIATMEGCRFGSVSENEATRFKDTYVTLPDLVAAFGFRHPLKVLSILDRARVEAVCRRPVFQTYLFRRNEAFEAIRSWSGTRDATRPPDGTSEGPMLKPSDVAERLGTGRAMALQLVARGLLTSTRRGKSILMPASEVERFLRRYVFSNELARLTGRTHRHGVGAAVTKVLIRGDVRPVCSKPDFVNYVFDRAEAVGAIERLGLT